MKIAIDISIYSELLKKIIGYKNVTKKKKLVYSHTTPKDLKKNVILPDKTLCF